MLFIGRVRVRARGFESPLSHLQGTGTYYLLACDNIVSTPWLTFEVCSNLCGVQDRRCDGTPQAANLTRRDAVFYYREESGCGVGVDNAGGHATRTRSAVLALRADEARPFLTVLVQVVECWSRRAGEQVCG